MGSAYLSDIRSVVMQPIQGKPRERLNKASILTLNDIVFSLLDENSIKEMIMLATPASAY